MKIKGELRYLGWNNDGIMITGVEKTLDLKPTIIFHLTTFHHKPIQSRLTIGGLVIKSPGFEIKDVSNEDFNTVILNDDTADGIIRTIEMLLIMFNGLKVTFGAELGKYLYFSSDFDDVPLKLRIASGASCNIPKGAEKNICQIGTTNCCAFVSFSQGKFRCEKFNPSLALEILNRVYNNDMNAKRIGNCCLIE